MPKGRKNSGNGFRARRCQALVTVGYQYYLALTSLEIKLTSIMTSFDINAASKQQYRQYIYCGEWPFFKVVGCQKGK